MTLYDRLLGDYPINAWDDDWLEQARAELREPVATAGALGDEIRRRALEHVEAEISRRRGWP